MKKTLLSLAAASLICGTVAEARFFVGVEGGYTTQHLYETALDGLSTFNFTFPSPSIIGDALDKGMQGYSLSVMIGSEDVGKIFGTRWYLGGGYTSVSKDVAGKNFSREFIDASLGFDMILNFYNSGTTSFGIFGGVSMDYHYWLDGSDHNIDKVLGMSEHMFDFSGKAGITTLLANHHRLEVYAKLPIGSMNISDSKEVVLGGVYAPANVSFGASYKFVF